VLGIIACQKNSPAEPLLEFGSVSDVEGNVYKTVKIGDQWWMAENLRVTKFADGAPLTFINRIGTDSLWSNLDSAAYTVINDTLFGYLYNFAAVSNDSHAIAPTGWHIATDEDWKLLESFLGMSEQEVNALGFRGVNEAEKLVSKYSVGWPEDGILFGSDKVGFNAKPGGCRLFNGIFSEQSNMAFWWTATPEGSGEAWYRYIDSNDKRIFRQHTYTRYGMSIRCVKD
jgi:uncharacterized protein (TIGR02145 family)